MRKKKEESKRKKTLDGAVDFVGAVGTVDVTVAVSSTVDALAVGATPFRTSIASYNWAATTTTRRNQFKGHRCTCKSPTNEDHQPKLRPSQLLLDHRVAIKPNRPNNLKKKTKKNNIKMEKGNRIKTWTVQLVGVVVTVANAQANAIATLTGANASVVAAPLATRVANYACRLISGRDSKAIKPC